MSQDEFDVFRWLFLFVLKVSLKFPQRRKYLQSDVIRGRVGTKVLAGPWKVGTFFSRMTESAKMVFTESRRQLRGGGLRTGNVSKIIEDLQQPLWRRCGQERYSRSLVPSRLRQAFTRPAKYVHR